MTIKRRVQFSIAVSIVLFILLDLIFFVAGREVRSQIGKERLAAKVERMVSELHILTTDYVVRPTPAIRDQWRKKYDELAEPLSSQLFESESERPILQRIAQDYAAIGVTFSRLADVTTTPATPSQPVHDDVDTALRRRLIGQLLVMNHGIMSAVLQLAEQTRHRIETAQRRAEFTAFNFIAVATILVLVIGSVTVASIVRGLREMSQIASQVAGGDLTVEVPAHHRHDEVGSLMKAFGIMTDSLRRQTTEVLEASGIISASASDISSSIAQVTASTSETAVAVTETTSTVEELKQTADVNSRKARDVSALAEHAAQTSQSGQVAAQAVATEIEHIQTQMTAISASLKHLSEQSRDIGEIIGAVDDLAEQSNLLAVNAAIEAAEAGEHGRGFTVVAEEIRRLAEQSRAATRRVRTILGDIQTQTVSAVRAAEQGGKAVAVGVIQGAAAGAAIETLAGSIEKAAESATQIAVSSHQQMVGVDQVAAAMENIRRVTNQNASAMQQVQGAARQLQELGRKLVMLMDRYKV